MKKRKKTTRFKRFFKDISAHTPFTTMLLMLILLWLLFAAGLFFAELNVAGASITTYGDALYWGVAAFTTAGIADSPVSMTARLVGGLWIVIGSSLFFGAIVATITGYFMRPMLRPHKRIIETIEYNLEQLGDLTIDELDLLKETVDTLIEHVEEIKKKQSGG
ncbi:two pore domain potassium channel family protein [Psychromonas sp.]|uniref:two pore domain potassium channel family protein n=1 Tax=Psychromonas sp. TaxID=1884585 RepID=UPI00356A8B23